MIDIVFPEQNEDEFIKIAEMLGYTSICFFYDGVGPVHYEHIKNLEKKTKLEIFTASSFSKNSKPDLFIEKTIDARQFIEKKAVDIIYGLESSNERDKLGYRLSGLNHTLCQMASERKKIIGFDFSSVLNSSGKQRAILIGRVSQNIELCRRYNVKTCIASFAKNPMQMRNPFDIIAFFVSIGMNEGDARKSMNSAQERCILNRKREMDGHLIEGIERV